MAAAYLARIWLKTGFFASQIFALPILRANNEKWSSKSRQSLFGSKICKVFSSSFNSTRFHGSSCSKSRQSLFGSKICKVFSSSFNNTRFHGSSCSKSRQSLFGSQFSSDLAQNRILRIPSFRAPNTTSKQREMELQKSAILIWLENLEGFSSSFRSTRFNGSSCSKNRILLCLKF